MDDLRVSTDTAAQQHARPAIGLNVVTSDAAPDAIIDTVERVTRHDAPILVAVPTDAPALHRRLDDTPATLVKVPPGDDPTGALATAAKERGLPGLIQHPDPGTEVAFDYEESQRTYTASADYIVTGHTHATQASKRVAAVIASDYDAETLDALGAVAGQAVDELILIDDRDDKTISDTAAFTDTVSVQPDAKSPVATALQHLTQDYAAGDAVVLLGSTPLATLDALPGLLAPLTDGDADVVIGRAIESDDETDSAPRNQRLGDVLRTAFGDSEDPTRAGAELDAGPQLFTPDAAREVTRCLGSFQARVDVIDTAIRTDLTVRLHEFPAQIKTATTTKRNGNLNYDSNEAPSTKDALRQESSTVVGIPAYNEAVGIGSTILAAQEYADEVVVVDDGSTDQTAAIAETAGATVITHDDNQGKGKAVQRLFAHARQMNYDVLVLLDGDGQHLPEDIPSVVKPIVEDECDIAIGSRYLEQEETETPLHRRFGQRVLDLLTFGSSGTNVTDSQSGFRALSPEAVSNLQIRAEGMGVESEMISSGVENDLEISEVPIDVRYEEVDGQTHNPFRHGLQVAIFLTQLIRDRHPLLFFGVPALFLLTVGAGVMTHSAYLYQTTGAFHQWRILLSGTAIMTGILSLFCGLVLSQIDNMINSTNE
ncbi:glycosyltransferase family 2 protein [Halopenitus persicus]|uniref:Glycosyl transferase family 2 n=1 Tax=Halopenitus persicus TaxID=1048396 RepID=A0A1H3MEC6_9EURY|nr:glycosyltransferase [Halopenitus persicus]SDY74966.1 Glycosyl transferase family 2 [Halopenitus persicus]